jgi:hypothetical protein
MRVCFTAQTQLQRVLFKQAQQFTVNTISPRFHSYITETAFSADGMGKVGTDYLNLAVGKWAPNPEPGYAAYV